MAAIVGLTTLLDYLCASLIALMYSGMPPCPDVSAAFFFKVTIHRGHGGHHINFASGLGV